MGHYRDDRETLAGRPRHLGDDLLRERADARGHDQLGERHGETLDERRRRRRDGHHAGRLGDQALPLPGGQLAGLDVVAETFRQLEPGIASRFSKQDGDRCQAGEEIGWVDGLAATLLVGERTALNFLQRLSGIATIARAFVDAAGGRITVLDTRKTTPTLRVLEKYAVAAGGDMRQVRNMAERLERSRALVASRRFCSHSRFCGSRPLRCDRRC